MDEFEVGHTPGLLQENAQNSFDAYPPGTPPDGMKIVVKYDADERTLIWRDFDTAGMYHCEDCEWGELPNGEPCTNDGCPWAAFHNMGYTTKGEGWTLGSRGMGKALQLLAGERTVVRTTLPDGGSAASEWIRTDDWQWRLAEDQIEELSAPGTEITTTEIRDEIHEFLLDVEKVIEEFQRRWFRLLEKGATITYLLVENGHKDRNTVPAPTWPPLDTSLGEEEARRIWNKVVVTRYDERLGELRNVELRLAREEFDPDDPRRGIAIVKNGKQTITHFTRLSRKIPSDIRRRIYGWCEAVCTDEEPFLNEAENSTHTGYRANVDEWRSTKLQLNELARKFADPFITKTEEKVTEKEVEEGKEILEVLNEALDEVPGFALFDIETDEVDREPPEPHESIYLSRLEVERKRFQRGQGVPVKAVIKNPTGGEKFVRAQFQHWDPTPVVVDEQEEGVVLPPGTPEEPGTAVAEWTVALDDDLAPGIHWARVRLEDKKWNPITDRDGQPEKARRRIYCETDPPEITRREEDRSEGDTTGGFQDIHPFKRPDLAEIEAKIDVSQAKVFLNLAGYRFAHYKENSANRSGYWPIAAEVVGEAIVDHLLEERLTSKDDWRTEEVLDLVMELEEDRRKLARTMVDKVKNR